MQFRGTPYIQADLRVSRPFNFHDRWSVIPFVEFFNLFNRNNPGANFVGNIAALPVPLADQQSGNVTAICTNAACTTTTTRHQLATVGHSSRRSGRLLWSRHHRRHPLRCTNRCAHNILSNCFDSRARGD